MSKNSKFILSKTEELLAEISTKLTTNQEQLKQLFELQNQISKAQYEELILLIKSKGV